MMKPVNNYVNITSAWGPYPDEDSFNNFLRDAETGEKYLKRELKTFFQSDFSRIKKSNQVFGKPDHVFHCDSKLLLIEICQLLSKRHCVKDLFYTFEEYPNVDINSKALLWISNSVPSKEIVKIVEKIHSLLIVGNCRIDFHVAIPIHISPCALRLNIIHSFGEKLLYANGKSFMVDFDNSTAWLTQRQIADILSIPKSTMSNIAKRWGLCNGNGNKKISMVKIREFIKLLEQKATSERGTDFLGKFVPMTIKMDNMLLPSETNALLKHKGNVVRAAGLIPRWITIVGSSNMSYRCLYDKRDVLEYKSRRNIK